MQEFSEVNGKVTWIDELFYRGYAQGASKAVPQSPICLPAIPQRPSYFLGLGHFATTVVEIPPRGRKSPLTSAQTGLAHRTTSSST